MLVSLLRWCYFDDRLCCPETVESPSNSFSRLGDGHCYGTSKWFCRSLHRAFDSQTKETLTIRQSSFGSKCELSQEFLKKVSKSGIVESLLSWSPGVVCSGSALLAEASWCMSVLPGLLAALLVWLNVAMLEWLCIAGPK
ncbi:DNA topoisomerase 2 [Camellia lanceoleosa]|uniref:DNA topoisomerase 2 n=1 Tax=Camellia lanceoleosa TaxID=1840588 RepID=A0ACC0IHF4_9ERIC|nr:DNA topoisomerase 2 [Camellia lanceoleosa]